MLALALFGLVMVMIGVTNSGTSPLVALIPIAVALWGVATLFERRF